MMEERIIALETELRTLKARLAGHVPELKEPEPVVEAKPDVQEPGYQAPAYQEKPTNAPTPQAQSRSYTD